VTSTSKIGRRSLKNFSPLLLLLVLARSCAPARLALAFRESNKRRAALRGTPRVEAWWARERADCLCRRRGKKKSEKKNSPFLFYVCALSFFPALAFFLNLWSLSAAALEAVDDSLQIRVRFRLRCAQESRASVPVQPFRSSWRGQKKRNGGEFLLPSGLFYSFCFAPLLLSPLSLPPPPRSRTTEFLFICSKGTKTCFLRVFRERNFNDTEARCLLVENKTKTITQ